MINKLKDYRRRGDLTSGVTVVRDKIELLALAVEPDFEKTLPWLDSGNPDDRTLASCFEIVKANIRSLVILATGDINLQNKAAFAKISFMEPPRIEK